MSRHRTTLAAMALVGLSLSACGSAGARDPETPVVVVTTSILGDVVSSIAGEAAQVEVLLGAGIDPHAFEPSAAQVRLVREADAVVANGLGLVPQLTDLLASAEAGGVPVLRVAELVDPLPFALAEEEHDEHDEGEEDDGHGSLDPHFWFDPVRMADATRLVGEHLARVDDGLPDEEWRERAEAYAARVLELHEEVAGLLERVPEEHRRLVTNHDNLGYLAERYGYAIVGAALPGGSTLAGASASDIAALAALMTRERVSAVFVEATVSDRIATALAREVGDDVAVVTLFTDALGPPGSGADTYLGLMRTDARRIAAALGGSGS